jgi:hypothetical protein
MGTTAKITSTSIIVADRDQAHRVCHTYLEEARPETFELADIALATVSLARTADWELTVDGVSAPVTEIDNLFNGVVAARIWEKVGTTHSEWELASVWTVQNGDLISDRELCEAYVVAGSSRSGDDVKVHMVGNGKTWNDRHVTVWSTGELVMVARKMG